MKKSIKYGRVPKAHGRHNLSHWLHARKSARRVVSDGIDVYVSRRGACASEKEFHGANNRRLRHSEPTTASCKLQGADDKTIPCGSARRAREPYKQAWECDEVSSLGSSTG
jgi:hypothetical protein